MCQIIHVDELQEETRELLEEQSENGNVTLLDAEQCEENWERGVREFADYADLRRIGRRSIA
jgi:hypothetical protein